jgi:hypothetical protein
MSIGQGIKQGITSTGKWVSNNKYSIAAGAGVDAAVGVPILLEAQKDKMQSDTQESSEPMSKSSQTGSMVSIAVMFMSVMVMSCVSAMAFSNS